MRHLGLASAALLAASCSLLLPFDDLLPCDADGGCQPGFACGDAGVDAGRLCFPQPDGGDGGLGDGGVGDGGRTDGGSSDGGRRDGGDGG